MNAPGFDKRKWEQRGKRIVVRQSSTTHTWVATMDATHYGPWSFGRAHPNFMALGATRELAVRGLIFAWKNTLDEWIKFRLTSRMRG